MDIGLIYKLAKKSKIAFKAHSVIRMQERKISADEIKEVLNNCEIIANYEDDFPLPSYLVLGRTSKNRYLHIVVAIDVKNYMLWIITVYEPNLSEWEIGFKKRRRKK